MAKLMLLCGKICSGKSYYAEKLKQSENAVLFSVDEVMFDFAQKHIEEDFDILAEHIKRHLYKKAAEVVRVGVNVILDFGFWSRKERNEVKRHFLTEGIETEWHYIHVEDADWQRNIQKRNQLVREGKVSAYILDEGLLKKLFSRFDEPDTTEIDVWVENRLKPESRE